MIGYFVAGAQGGGKYKRELFLAHGIAGPVFYPGFGTGIGERLEAECRFIKMGGLFGIADIKFYVIGALQG